MFIHVEPTPNPAVMKFILGKEISVYDGVMFSHVDEAKKNSLLAFELLSLGAVAKVFIAKDYISIEKIPSMDWQTIKPDMLYLLNEFFVAERPVFTPSFSSKDNKNDDINNESEIVQEIISIINSKVRPAVAQDGGDIIFDHFDEENNIIKVKLLGACQGCPSAISTLKNGVEGLLRFYTKNSSLKVEAVQL